MFHMYILKYTITWVYDGVTMLLQRGALVDT